MTERVAVFGAGTMGTGIAQVAATHGHEVVLVDESQSALENARASLEKILARQVEKGRMSDPDRDAILGRIVYSTEVAEVRDAALVIEAIVEDVGAKQRLIEAIEAHVADDCVIATNTSSLSVTGIASASRNPPRVLGLHFFNPAPLMPLVEVVPGIRTDGSVVGRARALLDGWGKTTVVARDTPGFIVNRVARPFYGEALQILDEGIADVTTIDRAMRDLGGFRMGPFELMDLIGNDVNYAVTRSVYEGTYYDPRYRPSLTQQRMVEAGMLGRKTGRGYYEYGEGGAMTGVAMTGVAMTGVAGGASDPGLERRVVDRIVAMLMNEAADAVYWNVASAADVDLAMTKGVNYPRGLLAWLDEVGAPWVVAQLSPLRERHGDRYRVSAGLRT